MLKFFTKAIFGRVTPPRTHDPMTTLVHGTTPGTPRPPTPGMTPETLRPPMPGMTPRFPTPTLARVSVPLEE